ncbi:MAG TPA: 2-oxoglutarate dehydrogenase, E2 component, dihydrolipoamide succinyltransferase [Acidimicrobiales bacterium]|nr:2-oxoglutarate dehydrogenase, E2 component, dihydrolipoamide succinyltransferase [Acidimicrobiales bacterium]
MADITMPQLGETVTEGTITKWFKQVGETVAEDEPLFEVSTDKVDSEVPSPVSGTLLEIKVPEGETVDVGAVLAVVGDGDAAPAEAPAEEAPAEEAPAAEAPAEPAPAPEAPAPAPAQPAPTPAPAPAAPAGEGSGGGRVLSPVVRRLLNEYGLDPATITGTGVGGRITRNDVLSAAEALGRSGGGAAPAAAPAPAAPAASTAAPAAPSRRPEPAPMVRSGERDTTIPHSNIRRRTAEHMRRSLDTSAHVYASIEVDFEAVDRVRRAEKDQWRAEEGFSLTYLPFISRAVVDAIHDFPEVNATFSDEALVVHNYVNLGIAVDLDFKGLMVPVVRDADGKRLRALAREISDLAARARSKKLSPDDIADGTFTITNPGPFGTLLTLPIINQPQVAILSTDGVKRRPVVIDLPDGSEGIAIHSVGNLALTWDHRAFDGAYAAAFLARVKDNLETRDWAAEL